MMIHEVYSVADERIRLNTGILITNLLIYLLNPDH